MLGLAAEEEEVPAAAAAAVAETAEAETEEEEGMAGWLCRDEEVLVDRRLAL